jgi:hypothetical protein
LTLSLRTVATELLRITENDTQWKAETAHQERDRSQAL